MKDNTLRDDIDELVTEASRYDMRSTDYDNITDKILTLLAEEVRKARTKAYKDHLGDLNYLAGMFDNEKLFSTERHELEDRIKQLEKGK